MIKISIKEGEVLIYELVDNDWIYTTYGGNLQNDKQKYALIKLLNGDFSQFNITDKQIILEIQTSLLLERGK